MLLARFDTRRPVAIVAGGLILALPILLVFPFAGSRLLRLFGLTRPALRIAAGFLLFLIANRMLLNGTREFLLAAIAESRAHLRHWLDRPNVLKQRC